MRKNSINVVLEEDNKSLEEAIVVGSGIQCKEAVVCSGASVIADVLR